MWDRSRSPRRGELDDTVVSDFIAENEIDESAAKTLRSQSEAVLRAVIEEGTVSGRNKSAILMGRINRASAAVAKPVLSARSYQPTIRHSNSHPGSFNDRQADPISTFILENELDEKATQKLLEQTPIVQKLVLAEGPLTGRNRSAVFAGRLRRILESGAADGIDHEHVLTAFATENGLDNEAIEDLGNQTLEVQRLVIEEGSITGRNPSAILKSRIRRILDGRNPAKAQLGASQAEWQSQQRFASPFAISVEAFANENNLDDSARLTLFEQPLHVQEALMMEGPLSGRNISAVFHGRLRRLQSSMAAAHSMWAAQAHFWHPAQCWPPQMPQERAASKLSGALVRNMRTSRSASPVSTFVKENALDEKAELKLREQSHAVQKKAIARGPVTGRNTSAVFLGRLKQILENPSPDEIEEAEYDERYPEDCKQSYKPESIFKDGAEEDLVGQFAAANGLDAVATEKLLKASPDVQQKVIQEGAVTGRNVNAVFLGRLRRAEKM